MSIILYIILLTAAALFYPLYENELSFAVLATLLILPVLLAIQLAVISKSVNISGSTRSGHIYKNEGGKIDLRLSNKSFFSVSHIAVEMHTETCPGGASDSFSMDLSVAPRSAVNTAIDIDSAHLGVCRAYIDSVTIKDSMGLFRKKLRISGELAGQISVIPRINSTYAAEAEAIVKSSLGTEDDDGEKIITTGPGDVIDFRDFREGDRTVHIHHKLSARFDKDIVKIMGVSDRKKFLVLPSPADSLDERDMMIEKALSIAYYIHRCGEQSFIAAGADAPTPINSEEEQISAACTLVAADINDLVPEHGYICCEIDLT